MKKKSGLPMISLLFLAFFIGVFQSLLVYTGYLEKFTNSIKVVPFYLYPIILILSFYITLIIHELAHLVAFKIQGVKIRALYLTMFVFYKKQNHIRFTIRPKLWVLFGGLVVPDIEQVHDEESFFKLRKKFSIALIAAPIATIIFGLLIIIIFIMMILFSYNFDLIGVTFIFTLFSLLWSFLYYMTFNLHTESLYGDFVAYRNIKSDDLFALSQMIQYTMFSSSDDVKTNDFLFDKIKQTLNQTTLNYHLFCQMLIISYIHGILYEEKTIDETLHSNLIKYAKTIPIRDEHALMVAYELVLYFYKTVNLEEAYTLLDRISKIKSKKIDVKISQYLQKKTEHQLNLYNHLAFLSNDENIYIGQMWIFEPIINPYEIARETHQVLPYVEFSCKIDPYQNEK